MAFVEASLFAALAALDVRLNLPPLPNRYSAIAVCKAIGIVTLATIEITSPVRRFVSFGFVSLVYGHLQMVKVLEVVALLSLQQSKHLVDLARSARVFAATLAASISCVLNRVMQLRVLACLVSSLVDTF
jgi:hypothetical protein